MTRPTAERNDEIRRMASEGVRFSEIAVSFGLSRQRIDQIVNRKKHVARMRARAAECTGSLRRPKNCQRCGRAGTVHAHHPDYDRPLTVFYLCPMCHSREHAASRSSSMAGRALSLGTLEDVADALGLDPWTLAEGSPMKQKPRTIRADDETWEWAARLAHDAGVGVSISEMFRTWVARERKAAQRAENRAFNKVPS